jgi:hypothetical protein
VAAAQGKLQLGDVEVLFEVQRECKSCRRRRIKNAPKRITVIPRRGRTRASYLTRKCLGQWRGREYRIRGNAALARRSSTEQRDRERHDDGRMEALTQSDGEPEADSDERNDAERQQCAADAWRPLNDLRGTQYRVWFTAGSATDHLSRAPEHPAQDGHQLPISSASTLARECLRFDNAAPPST